MSHPLSIGVPAYNQGAYLAETLESLLAQSTAPLEIVVSDNHSTDETPRVLERFAARVRVVRPPAHLAMTAHWNFVVAQMRSPWFSLLGSDDRARPEFVATMLRGIAREANAVLVRAGHEVLDAAGRVIGRSRLRSVPRVCAPPGNFLEQLTGPKVSFAAFALRRSVWQQVGGFPEACRIYGDWAMWLQASASGSFIREDAIVGQYRAAAADKSRARVLLGIADDVYIATRLIPRMAGALGRAAQRSVRAASRRRCLAVIRGASELLPAAERAPAVVALLPWAHEAGCARELARFAEGRVMRASPFVAPARRLLRAAHHGLLMCARGR